MTGSHSIPPSSLVYRHSRTNLSLFLDISSGYVYVCACYVSRCQTLHTLEDALVLPNASSWEFMSHFLTLTEATITNKPKVRNPVLTFGWGKLKFHSFSQSPAGLSLRLFSSLPALSLIRHLLLVLFFLFIYLGFGGAICVHVHVYVREFVCTLVGSQRTTLDFQDLPPSFLRQGLYLTGLESLTGLKG